MAVTDEQADALRDFLNKFFADVNGKNRVPLEKYIDLEKALLEQYQQYVKNELNTNNDVLQNFTKMMMGTCMQIVAFQRDSRARFLDLQSSIAENHLRFLDEVKQTLAKVSEPKEPGDPPDVK
jgi:hypothetical protein